jgi:hypothetical protein
VFHGVSPFFLAPLLCIPRRAPIRLELCVINDAYQAGAVPFAICELECRHRIALLEQRNAVPEQNRNYRLTYRKSLL